jgi:hypothetical protein
MGRGIHSAPLMAIRHLAGYSSLAELPYSGKLPETALWEIALPLSPGVWLFKVLGSLGRITHRSALVCVRLV